MTFKRTHVKPPQQDPIPAHAHIKRNYMAARNLEEPILKTSERPKKGKTCPTVGRIDMAAECQSLPDACLSR